MMRAISMQANERFADVLLLPENDTDKRRGRDALALDEPVTFRLTGVLVGDVTGVVMRRSGVYFEFRVSKDVTRGRG